VTIVTAICTIPAEGALGALVPRTRSLMHCCRFSAPHHQPFRDAQISIREAELRLRQAHSGFRVGRITSARRYSSLR
jgi:hypothetical protein